MINIVSWIFLGHLHFHTHVRVLQVAMEMILHHVLSQRRQETHVSNVDTANARHVFAIDDGFTRAEI